MASHAECLPGICRPSRLGAVWLSYRTNLMWIVIALFLSIVFSVIASIVYAADPSNTWAVPSAPLPTPSENFLSSRTDHKIDWGNLRSLWLHELDLCEPLWTPGAIPKLESLTVCASITDRQFADLCRLYDLKSLTLMDVRGMTPDGFSVLQHETRLEYLQISGVAWLVGHPHPLHDAVSLRWPPNLKILNCDDTSGISLQRLKEWQQLRQLECLSTRLMLRESDDFAELLETLERFPSLRRLFLVDLGKLFPPSIEDIQAELPNVRVRPTSYDPTRGPRVGVILVAGMLVILLVSIQLSSQFVTTASVLTPRFTRSHLTPVVGLFVATFVISFYLYWHVGCSFLVAAGLCGASFFIMAAEARMIRDAQGTRGNQLPGFMNVLMIFPLFVGSLFGVVLAIVFMGSEFEWFLRGHHSWLSCTLLVGSLWGVFDLIQWQIDLARNLEAVGAGDVPLSMFDQREVMSKWMKNISGARDGQPTKTKFVERAFDSKMDRFLESVQSGKPTASHELWRYGSQVQQSKSARFVTVFSAAGGVMIGSAMFAPQFNDASIFVFVTFQILIMVLAQIVVVAESRLAYQQMELLRPISRQDWTQIWFHWVAGEMAPALVITAGFWLTSPWLVPWNSWTLTDACLADIAGMAVAGIVFAVMMFVLTLRSWAQKIAIVIACIALMFVLLIPVALAIDSGFEWKTPIVLAAATAAFYLIAFFMIKLAWWRWQNWEVGDFG